MIALSRYTGIASVPPYKSRSPGMPPFDDLCGQTMDVAHTLEEDISDSISKFIHFRHECSNQQGEEGEPLVATPSELIVMALVDMQRPATSKEMELHITRPFRLGYRVPDGKSLHAIYGVIQSGFDLPLLEVPLEPGICGLRRGRTLSEEHKQLLRDQNLSEQEIFVKAMSAAHPLQLIIRWPEVRLNIHIRDAALFLRRRLFSPWSPDKHFPIMETPCRAPRAYPQLCASPATRCRLETYAFEVELQGHHSAKMACDVEAIPFGTGFLCLAPCQQGVPPRGSAARLVTESSCQRRRSQPWFPAEKHYEVEVCQADRAAARRVSPTRRGGTEDDVI